MRNRWIAGAALAAATFATSAGVVAADTQQGLVDVYAADTTVQIPVAIAANVC